MTKGSPLEEMMFQSNVGNGLIPAPFENPVIADKSTLLGAIHAIQLKALSAVKI